MTRTKELVCLTIPELQQRWNCSYSAVRNKLLNGDLEGFKVGSWRIPLESVLDYEKGFPNGRRKTKPTVLVKSDHFRRIV